MTTASHVCPDPFPEAISRRRSGVPISALHLGVDQASVRGTSGGKGVDVDELV